jgi:HAMP domain-containing protein
MDISIDRYLDDGKSSLVTLALRSRTTEMHSVLSALDAGQKAAVNKALKDALDEIVAVMQPVAAGMPKK